MKDGLSMDTAIQIENQRDIQNEISRFVDEKHGQGDGEYFVLGEQKYKHQSTQREYHILFVEYDGDNRQQYWFEIV